MAKPAAAEPAADVVTSLGAVARALGRSERTVHSWRARGMPGGAGRYDLTAIRRWVAEHITPNAPAEPNAATAQKHKWEAELARVRAERAQLKLDVERRLYVPIAEAERLIVQVIHEAKTHLVQLPDQVRTRVPTKVGAKIRRQVHTDVTTTVRKALDALAAALERWAEELERDGSDGGES